MLPQIATWQNRALDEVYPVVCVDTFHDSVRDHGIMRKLAALVILGITCEGTKKFLRSRLVITKVLNTDFQFFTLSRIAGYRIYGFSVLMA